MAVRIQFQPLPPFLFLLFFSYFFISPSTSQSTPQNIEVFFPTQTPPLFPPSPPPPPPPPLSPPTTTTTAPSTVVKAVAITAAITLVSAGLLFLLLVKYKRRKKNKIKTNLYAENNNNNPVLPMSDKFVRFEGLKGVIVDEEGLDVLYWRKLDNKASFNKEILVINEKEEEKKMMWIDNGGKKSKKFDSLIQEVPLLKGSSSGSHVWPAEHIKSQHIIKSQLSVRPPPPTPSPPPPSRMLIGTVSSPAPPPPPPPPVAKKSHMAPPPPSLPPKTSGLTLSPPPPPPAAAVKDKKMAGESKEEKSSSDTNQVKLKPLHWEKVNADVEHSMVWHKFENGSFRVDDNLMEALFGTMATNKKSPKSETKSGPPSKIFILDTRKSQNTMIVLRSIAVSRREIIDCLHEGKGLAIETLEKLTRITLSEEEMELIINFEGDIMRLADAESFLYHILRAVPSAFTRFNAMLFKSNYTSEVLHLKNSLKTLELACKELKTRGLFMKLLEAVLKAGNRMNVGTSRGNAQAFNLDSLLKLSDVKSIDGKTTLLHFVVEEVVQSEGKRCIMRSTSGLNSGTSRERDYIRLGLPVVGGVSSEFSNVKKAAGIDHDALSKSCSGLRGRLVGITKTMEECEGDGGGRGFVTEMEKFLEGAKEEIQVLRAEEERVMQIVKNINEYYQAGASEDNRRKQFHLFVIVRAFLEMVDKACVDIAIKMQKRRSGGSPPETATAKSPERPSVKFPLLPENFISGASSD